MGKFDQGDFAETLHGMTITPEEEPGILMEATWDENGDIDRESFLVEVENGKQVVKHVLPKLGEGCEQLKSPLTPPGAAESRLRKQAHAPWSNFIHLLDLGAGDRAHLRADRGRLHAAVADLADDQFRPGRIRHAAGVLHADRDELSALPFWLALLIGIALSLLMLGVALQAPVVDPMLQHGVLPLVIATMALAIFIKEAVKDEFYGAEAQPSRRSSPADRRQRSSARVISLQSLGVLAVAIAAVVALPGSPDRHLDRPQMQATAQNPTVARILGIPVERMILYTFLINAVLVALASLLITPIYLAKFSNGEMLGLAAFIAAIVGGFNQVRGAIVGGPSARRRRQSRRGLHLDAVPRRDAAVPPDRRHPVPAAGPARPRRGAHGMIRSPQYPRSSQRLAVVPRRR